VNSPTRVHFDPSSEESDLLARLTEFVKFAGRYPMPESVPPDGTIPDAWNRTYMMNTDRDLIDSISTKDWAAGKPESDGVTADW
jgi:hypothetical protein